MSSFLSTYRNWPIGKKLTFFCVATSFISLIIATSAITIYDRADFKDILKDEISVLSNVIANRSSAAIVFDDSALAYNNLKPLEYRKSIVAACVYKVTENLSSHMVTEHLASYPNGDFSCPALTPGKPVISEMADGKFLDFIQPIYLDDNIVGYLYLKSSLSEIERRLINNLVLFLIGNYSPLSHQFSPLMPSV